MACLISSEHTQPESAELNTAAGAVVVGSPNVVTLTRLRPVKVVYRRADWKKTSGASIPFRPPRVSTTPPSLCSSSTAIDVAECTLDNSSFLVSQLHKILKEVQT